MELHKAIKNVIEAEGIDAIMEPRLINVLSDYKSFDMVPAAKYILKSVIVEGYVKKLIAIGTWNDESGNLCNQFVGATGFRMDYVYFVFQSIAFALGYISSISSIPSNCSVNLNNFTTNIITDRLKLSGDEINKLDKTSKYNYKFTAEKYLNSIVEVKGDSEKDLGLKISVTSSYEIWEAVQVSHDIIFHIDFKGKNSHHSAVRVYLIVYSTTEAILSKQELYLEKNDYGYEAIAGIEDDVFDYVGNIGRIVLYY